MEDELRQNANTVVALADEDDDVEDMPPLGGGDIVVQEEEPIAEEEKSTYVGPNGKEDRTCVYPLYLNSKRSWHDGRKVPAALAVVEPLAIEIYKACTELELNATIEVRPPA
jgi:hypothetical protein